MTDASNLAWRGGNTARIAFLVTDAPQHAQYTPNLIAAYQGLRNMGVHVYPIAASGIDDLGEFSMRTGAEITGGRYMFLTDDSGIGNSHLEPTIPCYYVTYLDQAMLRMLKIELTGQYIEPDASTIQRVGGDTSICTPPSALNVDAGVSEAGTETGADAIATYTPY
jgi:hypothetical protein